MKAANCYILFFVSCLTFLLVGCNDSNNSNSTNHSIFRLVTKGRIAYDGGLSRGVAWGDYDGDGDPDLYVSNSNGQWNALYRNDGKGNFKKITAETDKASETVIHGGSSQGVNWVDYDNDRDLDLFVVSRSEEPNLLFRNEGDTSFTKITDSPLTLEGISASMACWVDMDKDGDLDVFLAGYSHPNVLFRNLGAGKFERVNGTIATSNKEGRARACGCADTNNDGLPDLYVANAMKPNSYFKNIGNWKFERVENGHHVEDVGYSYGVSFADYDEDGDLDLFIANFNKENFLYNNDGEGNFTPLLEGDLTKEKGGASKGHSWGDYDNDGDLDLFIANGTYKADMENFLFLNQGNGHFKKDLKDEIQMHADTSAGAAHADFDRDGDLDVFVANWGGRDEINRLYENISSKKNWVSLKLDGNTSNTFGVGAKAEIFISNESFATRLNRWMYPVTGYASQNDYELHFGLGKFSRIDSLVIHWPSGVVDIHENVKINNHWLAEEQGALTITN